MVSKENLKYTFNIHNACKILVASGIPNSETKVILNTVQREYRGSGAVFVVQRLKLLKEFVINKYLGIHDPKVLQWFRKTPAGNPKDKGWRRLIQSKPDKALNAVSSLLLSFYHKPDQHTKDAIYENVLHTDNVDLTSVHVENIVNTGVFEFSKIFSRTKYGGVRRFEPSTMKGVSFPLYQGIPYRVKTDKRTGEKDTLSLVSVYHNSILTAPPLVFRHIMRLKHQLDLIKFRSNQDQQDIEYLTNLRRELGWNLLGNDSCLIPKEETSDYVNKDIPDIVGSIGIIPSPGYKDRVIANPNALVQSFLYNLGEFLGDVTKRHSCCFVYDQQAGIGRVQRYLKAGYKLASVDMSAATDRLSADVGFLILEKIIEKCESRLPKYNPLSEDVFKSNLSLLDIEEAMRASREEYNEHLKFKLLKCDIELFKECSRGNFFIGNLGNDNVDYITYRQGQPMGLKPSFPLLTIMNIVVGLTATYKAVKDYSTEHNMKPSEVLKNEILAFPTVVGDDIVLDERAFHHYAELITAIGGRINTDKTARSSVFAKFCSRIITKNDVIREKPRYLDSARLQNANTFNNLLLLKPWERDLLKRASALSLKEEQIVHIADKQPFEHRYIKKALSMLYKQDLIVNEKIYLPETFKLIIQLSESLRDKQKTAPHVEELNKKFPQTVKKNNSLDFVSNLQQVSVPLFQESFDHHTGQHKILDRDQSFFYALKNIVARDQYDIDDIHSVFLDFHPGKLLIDSETIVFQPEGTNLVFDFKVREILVKFNSIQEFTSHSGMKNWSEGYFRALELQLMKEKTK